MMTLFTKIINIGILEFVGGKIFFRNLPKHIGIYESISTALGLNSIWIF